MDDTTLALCLHSLERAERLMSPVTDGWHLARLSHVIEGLKESYGISPSPTAESTALVQ